MYFSIFAPLGKLVLTRLFVKKVWIFFLALATPELWSCDADELGAHRGGVDRPRGVPAAEVPDDVLHMSFHD